LKKRFACINRLLFVLVAFVVPVPVARMVKLLLEENARPAMVTGVIRINCQADTGSWLAQTDQDTAREGARSEIKIHFLGLCAALLCFTGRSDCWIEPGFASRHCDLRGQQ